MTALLAAALQEVALPWQAWAVLRPDLALVCLFYWRLYRPDRCGAGVAFLVGLLIDLQTGVPIGLNAMSKIIIILLVGMFGQRLRTTDYLLLLPIIFLMVLLEEFLQLGIMVFIQGVGVRWTLFAGKPVATLLLAPALTLLLIHLHRAWLEKA